MISHKEDLPEYEPFADRAEDDDEEDEDGGGDDGDDDGGGDDVSTGRCRWGCSFPDGITGEVYCTAASPCPLPCVRHEAHRVRYAMPAPPAARRSLVLRLSL